MARSIDIAYYLLDKSIERVKKNRKYYMDLVKLHRLMYLGQCFMSSMYQMDLFEEKVFATNSAPFFNIYIDGLEHIPAKCGYGTIKNIDKLKESIIILPPTYTKARVCDLILDIYGKYQAEELIKITNKIATCKLKNNDEQIIEIERYLLEEEGQKLFNPDDFDLTFGPKRRGYEMLDVNRIRTMLLEMTENTKNNIKIIEKHFGTLKFRDEDNQSILHILVDNKYHEGKCLLAIKSLLQEGLSPNLEADYNYNFIQTALYAGYSENFILNIIKEALKYKLNINHTDSDKDTIMYTAIYSDDYLGDIEQIYELLCANGYDSTKIGSDGRNLIEAMIYQKQYNNRQIEEFYKVFKEQVKGKMKLQELQLPKNNIDEKTEIKYSFNKPQLEITKKESSLTEDAIKKLEKFGTVLTNQQYVTSPTIGREKELKNLIITLAQDSKTPIIVGASGVGKTALALELVYRIQTNQVPKFLQGKTILEITPDNIVAGAIYVGQFEQNMKDLMNVCKEYDIILLIDEIHTIYGIGTTKDKNQDMAAILKRYLDKTNLKVIGITTESEYQEYFGSDALKKRFEKVTVLEPTNDVLYQIINKVIDDYYIKTNIKFNNEFEKELVVKTIIEATQMKHRVYNDRLNNPDLAISIIDKAFAYAKVYDEEFITLNNFIESFENCDRIYESVREKAISTLKNSDNNKTKPLKKVLQMPSYQLKK